MTSRFAILRRAPSRDNDRAGSSRHTVTGFNSFQYAASPIDA